MRKCPFLCILSIEGSEELWKVEMAKGGGRTYIRMGSMLEGLLVKYDSFKHLTTATKLLWHEPLLTIWAISTCSHRSLKAVAHWWCSTMSLRNCSFEKLLLMFQEMQSCIVCQCCSDLERDDATVTEGKCTRLFSHIPVLTCLLQIHTHTIFPHSAAPLLVLTTQPLHFSSREGKDKISEITWLLRNHSCNPHIYSSSLPAYDTAVFPGKAIYQQWNISLWILKCWEKARQDKHIKVLYRGSETM